MCYEEILKIGGKKHLLCGNYSDNLSLDCEEKMPILWCLERLFLPLFVLYKGAIAIAPNRNLSSTKKKPKRVVTL